MKKNGFQLTELMIVIAIISILGAILTSAFEEDTKKGITNTPIVEIINTPTNSVRASTVRNEQ